jgi:hypothetical protein
MFGKRALNLIGEEVPAYMDEMVLRSAICIDAVLPSEIIYDLHCDHIFHAKCLEEWFLNKHSTCPLCHATFYEQPPTLRKFNIIPPLPAHLRGTSDFV